MRSIQDERDKKTEAAQEVLRSEMNKLASRVELSVQAVTNDAHRAQDEVVQIRGELGTVRIDFTTRQIAVTTAMSEVMFVAKDLIELVKIQMARLDERYHDHDK